MTAKTLDCGAPQRLQAAPRGVATVVDIGVGNLGSVERALRTLGAAVSVSRDPEAVAASSCLLLPGVGAFRPPREQLRGALEEGLREAVRRGAWLLGICVGYQLLFEAGEEHGATDGLGLFPGTVARLPETVQLPHIGWNRLRLNQPGHELMRGIAPGAHAYFVHSYAARDVPPEIVVASCLHGAMFPAAVAVGRVMGTQFHPEKSGAVGLRLLDNFLRLALGGTSGTATGH